MKIYKSLVLFIFIGMCCIPGVHAQLTVLFNKGYTLSQRDTAFALTLTAEGDLLIVGATDANDTTPAVRSEMFLLKVRGADGDSLDANLIELDTNFMVNDAVLTAAGYYLLPGGLANSGRIFKIDNALNIVDTCNAKNDTNYYARVIELPNEDLVAIHSKVLNKDFSNVIRMNSTWDTIWQTGFSTENAKGLQYYNNEKLIVSGWDNNNDYPHPTVTGYTMEGNLLHYEKINEVYAFNKNVFIDTNTLVLMNLKEKIFGGTVGNLVRTNDIGEYLWYEDLNAPKSIDINDIVFYDDYIITVSNTLHKDTIAFSVIDGEGALINYLNLGSLEPVLAGMERINDMIIVAGTQNDTLDTLGLRRQVFVAAVAIDSSWFQVTVGTDEILFVDGVSVYPNPTTGIIHIAIQEGDPFEEKTALLLNASGALVDEFRFNGPHFQSQINQHPPGLYFIKLVFADGRTQTQKVVLMR